MIEKSWSGVVTIPRSIWGNIHWPRTEANPPEGLGGHCHIQQVMAVSKKSRSGRDAISAQGQLFYAFRAGAVPKRESAKGSSAAKGQGLARLDPRLLHDTWRALIPSKGSILQRIDLRARRRLESKRPPLVWPRHRNIDETLETEATWQASLDRGLDDVRGEERERQSHPDRTVGLVLPQGERLQSLPWVGQKFFQPTMSIAEGIEEDSTRVGSHRPGAGLPISDALNDLPLAIRRGRRPWKRQSPGAHVCLSGLRQLDLNLSSADRDAINQVANIGLRYGAVGGKFANGPSDERFKSCSGNANDRSRFALVALQSRLRDVVTPALGSLPRPGGAHPIAAIVEELSRKQRFGRLTCSLRHKDSLTIAKTLLDLVPQLLWHNRSVLALVR